VPVVSDNDGSLVPGTARRRANGESRGGRSSAVIDLLGMLALAELLAFDRMASDARLAPDLHRRAMLSEMAGQEIRSYSRLAERLAGLGVDPESAMEPFVDPLRDYHAKTEPSDWFEALAKAYVGDNFADDFMREAAASLDSPDRDLVLEVLHDSRHGDFAAEELRVGMDADPKLANRLSMWARRLVGEGMSQALRVAAERPALASLFGVEPDDQPRGLPAAEATSASGVPAMLKRLTTAHSARMAAVGLNN
jgi:hypothetical protein